MNKDMLSEKLRAKARRVLDKKIEDIYKQIDSSFPEHSYEIKLRMDLWGSINKINFTNLLEKEIETQEINFYNSVESIFYHLER